MLESILITAAIILVIVATMAASIAIVEIFDRLAEKAANKVAPVSDYEQHVREALAVANQK